VYACFNDPKIYVFKNDAAPEPIHVFRKHSPNYTHFVHLFDDVLCSVDRIGNLYTWHASSGKILDSFIVYNYRATTILQLSDTRLALSTGSNTIRILKHSEGRNIAKVRDVIVDIPKIFGMDACGHHVAAVGNGRRAEVWNSLTE